MKTVKYNPNVKTYKAGEKVPAYGNTRITMSADAALYIHVGAAKSLIGYGSEFKVEGPVDHHHFTSSVEISVIEKPSKVVETDGEVYTNAEKMPMESPAEAYVKQAVRKMLLKNQAEKKLQKQQFDEMMRQHEPEVVEDEKTTTETETTVEETTTETETTVEETTTE